MLLKVLVIIFSCVIELIFEVPGLYWFAFTFICVACLGPMYFSSTLSMQFSDVLTGFSKALQTILRIQQHSTLKSNTSKFSSVLGFVWNITK